MKIKAVLKYGKDSGNHYYRIAKLSGAVTLTLPTVDGQPAKELRVGATINENEAKVLASCYPVEVVA